jgi:hypothetical protein
MESPEDDSSRELEQPAWVSVTKVLLLIGMTAMLYMLGHAMVSNNFFTGQ